MAAEEGQDAGCSFERGIVQAEPAAFWLLGWLPCQLRDLADYLGEIQVESAQPAVAERNELVDPALQLLRPGNSVFLSCV